MSLIAWNCRGLGTPLAIRALKDVVKSSKAQIVGLVETKATQKRCEVVRTKLGFNCCFSVPARGRSGGLALFWNNNADVTVNNYSSFHIDFTVQSTSTFRVTLFYGAPTPALRARSWELIRQLSTLSSLPWCLMGDFNEILNFTDVSKNALRRVKPMLQFRSVLEDCDLTDLGFKGYKFTYTNRRKGKDETRCRLDRVLANPEWRNLFPDAFVYHLSTFHSDHVPIQLCFQPVQSRRTKLFRYEAMWSRDSRFKEFVISLWNKQASHLNFLDKLDRLKTPIKVWNKRVFGNVDKNIQSLRDSLSAVRQLPRTDSNVEQEKLICAKMDEWLSREEIMWQQRSRVLWLKAGDNNTSFFHRKATGRRKMNNISQLRGSDGVLYTDPQSLCHIALNYFSNVFSPPQSLSSEEMRRSVDILPRKVTHAHNELLLMPYTEGEVYAAIQQLHPSKAPGLDGFPAEFLQKYWDILKNDCLKVCLSALNDGVYPSKLNDTLLVLIPKQKKMIERMEELRPISLTTVVSKVVAKAMVNRLQLILPEVISVEQSAFIKGRLITDNFILAHECSHYIKKLTKGKKVFGSLKLDMSKAYDRVDWHFLKHVMLQLGFSEVWVRRIMHYVSSVRYCVRVNGSVTEFFYPHRGLRQGDPLSPYLFIICTEWLSHSLCNLHANNVLRGLRISRNAPFLTHLFFADDSLLLFQADPNAAEVLKSLLTTYENLSGQAVNYAKSELVLSPNAPASLIQAFKEILSVRVVSEHHKYLGLPLTLSRKRSSNFLNLLDRASAKSNGWSSATLSRGGKEVLIKAILLALPQYYMHCFLIPDCILEKYQSIIRKFWWSSSQDTKGINWVKYSVLCEDKEHGGLGFKDLKLLNLAFLAKQGWRLYSDPNLLISKVLKARYYHNTDLFSASVGSRPSPSWRSIHKGLDLLRAGCAYNNDGTAYWTHSDTSTYSIRSGYNLSLAIKKRCTTVAGESSNPSQTKSFWKTFWKLPVPRKVKIFGWRCFHNALPVGSNLCIRNISTDVCCPVCHFKVESSDHALLKCWWSSAVWQGLGIRDWEVFGSCCSLADVIYYFCKFFNIKLASLSLVTLWYIWGARNRLKHESISTTPAEAVNRILALSTEFYKFHKENPANSFTCSDFFWKPPPAGYIKINCDASWDTTNCSGSIGIIARDHTGNVICVRALQSDGCSTSVDCEGMSIMESFKLCKELGFTKVIVESDCAEAVQALNCRNMQHCFNKPWYIWCLKEMDCQKDWTVMLIRREANEEADGIAKAARSRHWTWTRTDACPFLDNFTVQL
ncbi:unnamed protein product [Rhodiola kirilowii]